jgi:aldose 1-epimerase
MAHPTDILRLRHGPFELELCPGRGGAITGFRHRGRNLMRPAEPAFFAERDPFAASSFALVPFSNRVADRRFGFRGQVYELPANFPPEPHAIHGQGWEHAWTVEAIDGRGAVLDFAHRIAGTPLDYRARQTLALDDRGLEVTLEVTNAGPGPMPAGLGVHPCFVRTPGVTLRARLNRVWLMDERKLPTAPASLPPEWDFASAPALAPLTMDHCFDGWDGRAEVHWPETGMTLEIEAEPVFGHLVIYIPPGREIFCVEPVSHVNDGFNLLERGVADSGVRVLAPGETLRGRVRFSVR